VYSSLNLVHIVCRPPFPLPFELPFASFEGSQFRRTTPLLIFLCLENDPLLFPLLDYSFPLSFMIQAFLPFPPLILFVEPKRRFSPKVRSPYQSTFFVGVSLSFNFLVFSSPCKHNPPSFFLWLGNPPSPFPYEAAYPPPFQMF